MLDSLFRAFRFRRAMRLARHADALAAHRAECLRRGLFAQAGVLLDQEIELRSLAERA